MKFIRDSQTKKILAAVSILLLAWTFTLIITRTKDMSKIRTITRNRVTTFKVPENWIIYQINKNYDFNIGYFKNGNRKDGQLCNINVITADLGRSPTFNQFLETSLAGKLMIENHKELKIAGQDAWSASYVFPYRGIPDPVKNDRVLFKAKDVYNDITLSYSDRTDQAIAKQCLDDFSNFLSGIELSK